MYYFILGIYLLSFFILFRKRTSLYREMAWGRYPYKRPYEYTGNRLHDYTRILIISLIPLLNTIYAFEILSRQDEFGKMIEESRKWREEQAP